MLYKRIVFVLFFLALLLPCMVYSQAGNIRFKHITSADGLSQNHGLCIVRDHKGFMWFGTEDGLNKYDGYRMTVYKNDPLDSGSLSNNSIHLLYEDSKKNLWIGTANGLNLYNRDTERFTRYTNDPLNDQTLSSSYVTALLEDSKGNLWVGTGEGLNLFNDNTRAFTRIKSNSYGWISVIYEDSKNNLWVGMQDGLYSFDRSSATFKKYETHPTVTMVEDGTGNLWIGTREGGLQLFDQEQKLFTKKFLHNPNDNQSIGSNVIFELFKDSKGRIWVGTENGGLNQFHVSTGTFTRYVNDINDRHSISNNSVDDIYEDSEGTIWAGVHRGGINYFNLEKEKFKALEQMPCGTGLSNKNIKSVFEDRQGKIWIGTDGGGLNCYDPTKGTFQYYRHDPNNKNSLSSDVVLSVFEDSDGILWVGTYLQGLNRFDRERNAFVKYKNDPADSTSIADNTVWCILEDNKKTLWIGTHGHGLNLLDKKTGRFKRYNSYSAGNNTAGILSNPLVYCLYQDSKDNLWIGTSHGLNLYNPEKDNFTTYFHDSKNKNSLSYSHISAIYQDSKGNLWIGTRGGLNRFDYEHQQFTSYTVHDGLPNEAILTILEDDHGNLWLGTLGGLSKFDYVNNVFKNYSIEDGLLTNEFSQNAALRTADGQMFFGGINGINIFHPDSVKDNSFVPPVRLTDFYILNRKVPIGEDSPLKANINEAKEITLSYRENVFTFEFAALNYIFTEKNQYAYKMEGFDTDWNYVGSKRTANYTNLNPGEYTFHVKGSNNDGVWNEEGTSIKIVITPPFWKTWWFRFLIGLFIMAVVLTVYKVRDNAVQKQKAELKKQVEERTLDLKKANTELKYLYKDIKDSIRSAQAIQQSIFPSEAQIGEHFRDSFILNKPKAVIGGDFYWFDVLDEKIILAVADCTGHGVSGAFMSINAHHLLNQAIHPYRNNLEASQILDRLHASIIKELHTVNDQSLTRDGMDISLCIFDKKNSLVQYAGSGSPLYILRNNEVTQIAADKFPIGLSFRGKSFTFKNNIIPLHTGDTLYMFSDGYADQFGGKKGELKFGYGRFRDFLLQIHQRPMAVQKTLLEENLDQWRKATEQLDDIMILGLKI